MTEQRTWLKRPGNPELSEQFRQDLGLSPLIAE
jgi:hypothetical protein